MATTASIRVVKDFLYRGSTRQFSNRYHFTNGAPSDSAHWTTLSDAITAAEKAIHALVGNGGAKIVATYGYDAGSEVPVFSKTYSLDGTASYGLGVTAPGDAAVLVRYATASRTSKNHPLYLFSYYHGVFVVPGGPTKETVVAAQVTANNTYAAAWVAGFSDGTTTHIRCGPNGDTSTGYLVQTAVTHRDFPRG